MEALLRLGAVLQQQRTALAIGNPVRTDGRTGREEFLDEHEARERAASAAAVLDGQRESDPAARREGTTELGIEAHPRSRARLERTIPQVLAQERADLVAQGLVGRGDGGGGECVDHRNDAPRIAVTHIRCEGIGAGVGMVSGLWKASGGVSRQVAAMPLFHPRNPSHPC